MSIAMPCFRMRRFRPRVFLAWRLAGISMTWWPGGLCLRHDCGRLRQRRLGCYRRGYAAGNHPFAVSRGAGVCSEIAAVVNQFLCTRNVGKYATMILLKLFPDGRVEYMNCGHVPPLRSEVIEVRRLEEGSTVVGLFAEATLPPPASCCNPTSSCFC